MARGGVAAFERMVDSTPDAALTKENNFALKSFSADSARGFGVEVISPQSPLTSQTTPGIHDLPNMAGGRQVVDQAVGGRPALQDRLGRAYDQLRADGPRHHPRQGGGSVQNDR